MVRKKKQIVKKNKTITPKQTEFDVPIQLLNQTVQVMMPVIALISLYNSVKFTLKHKEGYFLESGLPRESLEGLESFCEDVDALIENIKNTSSEESPLVH